MRLCDRVKFRKNPSVMRASLRQAKSRGPSVTRILGAGSGGGHGMTPLVQNFSLGPSRPIVGVGCLKLSSLPQASLAGLDQAQDRIGRLWQAQPILKFCQSTNRQIGQPSQVRPSLGQDRQPMVGLAYLQVLPKHKQPRPRPNKHQNICQRPTLGQPT